MIRMINKLNRDVRALNDRVKSLEKANPMGAVKPKLLTTQFPGWKEHHTGGGCMALKLEKDFGYFLITDNGGLSIPEVSDTEITLGAFATYLDDCLFGIKIDLVDHTYNVLTFTEYTYSALYTVTLLQDVEAALRAAGINLGYSELASILFD
jgi:hypothetical protein